MEIVVVCFGAPSIAGDALGPFVGSALVEKYNLPCYVYGTLDRPLTAKNMDEYLSAISVMHPSAVVLSVDASLGKKERIGKFTLRDDGVCPAAVGGRKQRYGDVGILGVVGVNDGNYMHELLNANGVEVSKMADKIAFVIFSAINELLKSCARV